MLQKQCCCAWPINNTCVTYPYVHTTRTLLLASFPISLLGETLFPKLQPLLHLGHAPAHEERVRTDVD